MNNRSAQITSFSNKANFCPELIPISKTVKLTDKQSDKVIVSEQAFD
jgi:hypothetical protein